MSESTPTSSLPELSPQDSAEALAGYLEGLANRPEPGSNKSKIFWHGWCGGQSDRKFAPLDEYALGVAQKLLLPPNP